MQEQKSSENSQEENPQKVTESKKQSNFDNSSVHFKTKAKVDTPVAKVDAEIEIDKPSKPCTIL